MILYKFETSAVYCDEWRESGVIAGIRWTGLRVGEGGKGFSRGSWGNYRCRVFFLTQLALVHYALPSSLVAVTKMEQVNETYFTILTSPNEVRASSRARDLDVILTFSFDHSQVTNVAYSMVERDNLGMLFSAART